MPSLEEIQGLRKAHDLLTELHDELLLEHDQTKPTLFGSPTKRHHEIMGASDALAELGARIVKATKEL